MPDLVADTHTTIWHIISPHILSQRAQKIMEEAEREGTIYISILTLIEIIYLVERKRVDKKLLSLLKDALDDETSAFKSVNVSRAVTDHLEKIPRIEVPEMPDRIIAATALYLKLPLVTKDPKIRSAKNVKTVW